MKNQAGLQELISFICCSTAFVPTQDTLMKTPKSDHGRTLKTPQHSCFWLFPEPCLPATGCVCGAAAGAIAGASGSAAAPGVASDAAGACAGAATGAGAGGPIEP